MSRYIRVGQPGPCGPAHGPTGRVGPSRPLPEFLASSNFLTGLAGPRDLGFRPTLRQSQHTHNLKVRPGWTWTPQFLTLIVSISPSLASMWSKACYFCRGMVFNVDVRSFPEPACRNVYKAAVWSFCPQLVYCEIIMGNFETLQKTARDWLDDTPLSYVSCYRARSTLQLVVR